MESINVEVHTVVFSNPENGYAVARVKAKGEPGLTTVVGNLGTLTPGESLILHGDWKNHPRFGRQFEAKSFEQSVPATENGVIRYLSSAAIKHIGPAIAKRMVDTFGVEALDVLDNEPERLLEIKGISKKKLEGIEESWSKQREIKNLILFLHSHDVPPTFAGRIFHLHGAQSVARLKENPYELAYEIRGVGFRTADNMALKLGFEHDDPRRLEAALVYELFMHSERGGHLFCPKEELFDKVSRMIGAEMPGRLEQALQGLEEKKRIHMEDLPEQDIEDAVYLRHFYRYETELCQRLYGLASHPTPVSRKDVEKVLPKVEAEIGFGLTDEQREAVFEACVNKVFIITGGPGTGKTTITKAIVLTLKKLKLKVKLAAPTGRAAKRLSEATETPAQTVHRLLQYAPDTGGFHHNEDHKLKTEALVVDEASMLDAQLCLSLLRALPLTSRFILVGDVNQLPSVGPGNVLSDLLKSGRIPSAVLHHIFRQAQESYIVVNAHRINEGTMVRQHPGQAPEADFYWLPQEDPAKVQKLILDSVCERIPRRYGLDPMKDIQVLTPMHKGEVGTAALNQLLQQRLNPGPGQELKRGNLLFREGDRVLQLRNNYEKDVFNGDLGSVAEISDGELMVEFESGWVHYEASEVDDLALAYAVSVHKSQGSEYPAVVMPVVTQHFMLLQRNLLYTGLTRARKLAVMVGSTKAFNIGLKNVDAGKRNTHLRHRLRAVFDENRLPV